MKTPMPQTDPAAPPDARMNAASPPPDSELSRLPPQDWQQSSQPVFVIEDSFYRSRTPPRPVHWSIAWSDLMMTMFILFLTLFAHLRTHQEIRAHGTPDKVADETVPVQTEDAQSTLIFHPISQDISRKATARQDEAPPARQEERGTDIRIRHLATPEKEQPEEVVPIPELLPAQKPVPETPGQQTVEAPPSLPPEAAEQNEPQDEALNTRIYDLSRTTLAQEKLEQFASVELVPDKTVRIILTGDLLFASGQAELTGEAVKSLKKLAVIIQKTPYMINVVGHTDDRPVRSARFPSNWELSLARAGRVARFLIDETKLPPSQFSVTGYSSFRPVKPNTNEENRKANRRVEIILSKKLPEAEAASPTNLQ